MNGLEVGRIEYRHGDPPRSVEVRLPRAVIAAGEDRFLVEFETPDAAIPRQTEGGPDSRRLGLFLRSLTLARR